MSVEITYWTGRATNGLPMAAGPGRVGGMHPPESIAITSSPVASSKTPDGVTAISLIATEAFRFEYTESGTAASAGSNYVAAGERLWLTPRGNHAFSLRTA